MWCDASMFLLEFLAALCAVAICGPCFLACTRRLVLGDEMLQHRGTVVHEADVLGCDEPACPYYKKNMRYLMVPAAARRRTFPASPTPGRS